VALFGSDAGNSTVLMKWTNTSWLLLSAAVLFGFIYFFERQIPETGAAAAPAPRLIPIKPEEITAVQLRRTNQFVVRAERTNQSWNITAPINYPAQDFAIDHLLKNLASLTSYTFISPAELKAGQKSVAEFGLDIPMATLTLHHGGRRTELLFGEITASGDFVYLQLLNTPGIYVVPAEIVRRLPQGVNDWRDLALVNINGMNADRFEVRGPGRGFAIQVNVTNQQYYLTKPSPARADKAKIDALLRKVQTEAVVAFIADDARAELDQFGLQPPEAEIVFGSGTNDLLVVQFGKSPSNEVVYARRSLNNNVVLVSRSLLEAVQVPASDLRDRRLLSFDPSAVDLLEISAEENFTVRRQGSNSWVVSQLQPMLADADLVRDCLNLLTTAEGEVEKDVVADFAMYGLAQPIRQYLLKGASTNLSDTTSNRLLAQLDVGGRRDGKVFARGPEATVYSVDESPINRLPVAAWQLRDRRVWSFTTNQVTRLTVQRGGATRQLLRGSTGEWKFDSGSTGIFNTYAVEEVIYRLGELRATGGVDRGEGKRQVYGFRENGDKLAIELRIGEKSQVLTVEFGDEAKSRYPYALAVVDGQTWIFEFPLQLYLQVVRGIFNQVTPPPAAPKISS
jgi:hypothetical protein